MDDIEFMRRKNSKDKWIGSGRSHPDFTDEQLAIMQNGGIVTETYLAHGQNYGTYQYTRKASTSLYLANKYNSTTFTGCCNVAVFDCHSECPECGREISRAGVIFEMNHRGGF